MQEVYRTIARLVSADLTVLILASPAPARSSWRGRCTTGVPAARGAFAVINLAAVPRERVETELFGKSGARSPGDLGRRGYREGRRRHAVPRRGRRMPLDAQTRLSARDCSEGAINSVGGRRRSRPNVRIIAATNRDLRALIREGVFREDLFFRLNVVPRPAAPAARPRRGHPPAGAALPGARARRRACQPS